MAYPVCIPVPENTAPPTDGEVYIKHVEFFGTEENEVRFEYRKLEKSLLFEYLRRKDTFSPDSLMAVSFVVQNENNNFCEGILKKSFYCEGRYYRFLGHSNSQLREKKCFLMNASEHEIHEMLARFCDFVKITDVGKRAKRIGLLFDRFNHIQDLAEKDSKIEPDVKAGTFRIAPRPFTNSCGFMSSVSSGFATKVRRQLDVKYPQPSAVQVIYQGFQGTLVLKDDPTNVHQVQFRKSMQKFDIPKVDMPKEIPFIGIVDYSRPHVNGYLDARLIMFLASRGVSPDYLKTLQMGYLDLLKKIPDDPASAEYFLRLTGRDAPNTRRGRMREVLTLRRDEIEEMIDHVYVHDAKDDEPPRRSVVRTRILVPKARVVFGVCDPYNKLENGECYFSPTLLDDEAGEFASEEKVVVARYPCYHPGDIQVLKLTHKKLWYENLKDCLVLPVKDRSPHAFEYSGGDLCASKFFVSWDQHLVRNVKSVKPCCYSPSLKETISEAWATVRAKAKWKFRGYRERKKKSREELIEYFANFTDDLPSRIDQIYMKLASTHGPFSKECKQLSKMSYQATNLTVDRGVLLKKLKKFVKLDPTRSTSSAIASPSSDRTPLLGGQEEEESRDGEENENVRFRLRSRRTPTVRSADEVRKEFDERAKRFVEEAQQEYMRN